MRTAVEPRSLAAWWAASIVAIAACTSGLDDFAVSGATSGATSATSATTSTAAASSGDTGGSGAAGTGGASASTGAGATGGGAAGGMGGAAASSTAADTAASSSTGPNPCGNGVIDVGEECDGMGAVTGCDASCKIVCNGPHDIHDTTTHHCYYLDPSDATGSWTQARTFCQNVWGGDLLIIELMPEYDFLHMFTPAGQTDVRFWVGGLEPNAGTYVWYDGSTIAFPPNAPPWMDTEPSGNGDCIMWRAEANLASEGLGDLPCITNYHPFCERPPPGGN